MNLDQLTPLFPGLVAAAFTVSVFSYLLGDNPLYRIAVHVFIGVAAAYAAIVAFQSVLIPRGEVLLGTVPGLPGDWAPFALQVVPWVLGAFILLKVSKRFASAGNFALAFLVGVGAALAVGGAITGTIFPQVYASWINPFKSTNPVRGLFDLVVILVATSAVLMYFFYTGKAQPDGSGERFRFMVPMAWIGQGFLTVGLATLYAGALAASFALFIERIGFLITTGQALLAAAGF